MTGFIIKRAKRSQARLRLGISGVSGSGKTMGALRLAKGIVQLLLDTGQVEGSLDGKIALIDSERKSSQLYADVVTFDTIELDPPYSVDRYQQAIEEIERAGYVVCIIDQISHAWAGPGGQLEWIDALKAKAINQMSPWSKVTPVQQEFYDRMLRSPMHIIATMRAKSEWVIDEVQGEGGRTKKVPRKIGLSPVQREGIEYEFSAMLDIDLDTHHATASKDRTRLFDGRSVMLDEDCGRRLAEWLQTGEATTIAPKTATATTKLAAVSGPTDSTVVKVEYARIVQELEDGVVDFELGFVDAATLPDLAAHFDKGQKFVRGFVKELGADVVKPFLERLIAAKDKRKAAMSQPPTPKEAAAQVPATSGAAPGPSTAETPAAAAPADLLDAADRMTVEDVKRLASFARNEGLTDEEALAALEVKDIADMRRSDYAGATDKLMKAARAKLKPARARKEKAAA
jgi:hypothetical protein